MSVCSVAMVNNVRQIIFSYKHVYSPKRLGRRMTDEQQAAIYLFMHRYHEDQQAKRKIWPRELREIYNNYQQTDRLKIHRPRLFLSCFDLPNKYCRYVVFSFFLGGGEEGSEDAFLADMCLW